MTLKQGWNDWGTEELYSSATPDALPSPQSETKLLFNLLRGPKENNAIQIWVFIITLLLGHFPQLSLVQMGL